MEEDKAAAYYDELSRKGQGAARFKQGLGFSSESKAPPSRGSALPSASSFLSSFVRASSPSKASELEKQAQLESIQNKLKKKPTSDKQEKHSRASEKTDRDRDRDRDRHSRRRSRSRERHRDRDRDRDRDRERKRRRSVSPRERRRSEKTRSEDKEREKDRVDFSKLIEGYDKMTPAERVKAKMKLQLAETAEKDETKGMGSGWERFEFNKDAPLDDEEIEAAEDDKALVKHIGQSFRFSAVETRREEQIKAAHDEAMFGASSIPPSISESEPEMEDNKEESNENGLVTSLLSDKVLAKQQGSWRDRARKV
ncbi:hypothetical protein ACB092_04G158100 [Castanea dentata]